MNPKIPTQLDPKLKEAYDRVMGFSPVNQTPTPQPTSIPNIHKEELHQVIATNSKPTSFTTATSIHQKPKISPILLVVVFVVFILVYTLFWFRFFSVPLPFLPQ